jgi:hypothetical protein
MTILAKRPRRHCTMVTNPSRRITRNIIIDAQMIQPVSSIPQQISVWKALRDITQMMLSGCPFPVRSFTPHYLQPTLTQLISAHTTLTPPETPYVSLVSYPSSSGASDMSISSPAPASPSTSREISQACQSAMDISQQPNSVLEALNITHTEGAPSVSASSASAEQSSARYTPDTKSRRNSRSQHRQNQENSVTRPSATRRSHSVSHSTSSVLQHKVSSISETQSQSSCQSLAAMSEYLMRLSPTCTDFTIFRL